MDGLFLPLLLTGLAFAAAVLTYRDIRRGGARYYALEREAILRRASFTLMAAVLLFLGTVFLLITQYRQTATELAVQAGEEIEGVPTLTPTLSILPPTPTATATVDPESADRHRHRRRLPGGRSGYRRQRPQPAIRTRR
jgi:hypothetical protein